MTKDVFVIGGARTPMTDYSLPGVQIGAKWRSGYPTIATSGATWVRGKRWGAYRGTLAVARELRE